MKYFLCVALILWMQYSLNAQVVIKPKAALTTSKLKRPPVEYNPIYNSPDLQGVKLGFLIGADFEYFMCKKVSGQAGFFYVQKGLKDNRKFYSGPMNYFEGYGYDFSYLEIPILLKYSLGYDFRIGTGPSFSYLLQTNYVLDGKRYPRKSSNYNRFDYGLNLDVSYDIGKFEIGTRYNHGLKSVSAKENSDPEVSSNSNPTIGKSRSLFFYASLSIK